MLALLSAIGIAGSLANPQTALSSDLHEIANLKSFKAALTLKPQHLKLLRKNGFFTSPSEDVQLEVVAGQNDYLNLPTIVTADDVLEIYHSFFDTLLRNVEDTTLIPETRTLTRSMLELSMSRYREADKTSLRTPAQRNVAFFAVADRLLGDTAPIPPYAKGMVDGTLALIRGHSGFNKNPIFGYDTDFSQFIVRGHYTKSPSLGRYFQTMMWYGLVPFALPKPGEAATNVQSSLFVSQDLTTASALGHWNRIYRMSSLFSGPANHLTPVEWQATASKVFGPRPSIALYANKRKLTQFMSAIASARQPLFSSGRTSGDNPDAVQMRFMPQRQIPDSYVLQRLSGDGRVFPSPLDVMTVLGSSSAPRILDADPAQYNPGGWDGYRNQRNKLVSEFADYPKSKWSSDLYWSWLDTLRQLLGKPESAYPPFMKTQAWADKSLYSALASWTELRHDTILYGEQTAAEQGDERPPNHLKGYVEPNLKFYRRLGDLVSQTSKGLTSMAKLKPEAKEQLNALSEFLTFLQKVTAKELKHQKLTQDENDRIRYVEGDLEGLHDEIMKVANGYLTLTQEDLDTALVADIHTGGDQALQVAVGHWDHLFAVAPIEGKLWLVRGSCFSYYEFKRPISDRMIDHKWKQLIGAGKIPPRPDWVKSFYVPIEVKSKKE